ncbi:hypothetical protein M9H61_06005 [Thalassospira sp. GO-4]|jgi:hypothetical protein|uniref:hypothetical protein n=1 Tax=Thalassospira sp. GO-4 TaxID=2946605 RepID=UPI002023C82D|nr:hypothetical protein [Thalassospira sp. GO-4]URK19052.1 hypothetical protein M9H61_06005 [Thalassospira sp. GO-4]
MPAMHFPKILAFVEGHMERMFIADNFRYVDTITLMNGVSWSEEAMSEQILTKFIAKDANPDLIWIWLDREDPSRSVVKIKSLITKKMSMHGFDRKKIKFLIPDQMTENLILSDEELMRSILKDPSYTYTLEGKNGKSHIKRLHKSLGINYKETYHGVNLLKKLRIANCAKASSSANDFYSSTNIKCWWIEP